MKNLLFLKKIDCYGQLTIFAAAITLALTNAGHLFTMYFVMGGWQLTSALLHRAMPHPLYQKRQRRYYGVVTLITGIVTGSGVLSLTNGASFFLPFLFLLLLAAPFIAVWYTCISHNEIAALEAEMTVTSEN